MENFRFTERRVQKELPSPELNFDKKAKKNWVSVHSTYELENL